MIAVYREVNNWFQSFLDEKCETGPELKEGSGALYMAQNNFCFDAHEYVRSTTDFYAALENEGFQRVRMHAGKYVKGLKLRFENEIQDDFLS